MVTATMSCTAELLLMMPRTAGCVPVYVCMGVKRMLLIVRTWCCQGTPATFVNQKFHCSIASRLGLQDCGGECSRSMVDGRITCNVSCRNSCFTLGACLSHVHFPLMLITVTVCWQHVCCVIDNHSMIDAMIECIKQPHQCVHLLMLYH
jgi:hypothetical protein